MKYGLLPPHFGEEADREKLLEGMATDHARSPPTIGAAKPPERYPHQGRRGAIRTDAQGVTAHPDALLSETLSSHWL